MEDVDREKSRRKCTIEGKTEREVVKRDGVAVQRQ